MNTFIIAEAGINHNGHMDLAKKLIDYAIKSKADAIKFQMYNTENLVSKYAQKAKYQKNGIKESQYEMLKKHELSRDNFKELKKYCDNRDILFMCSVFDLESIDFLNSLGTEIFKIGSGEITNLPFLEKIGSLNKKVIMSTGMSSMKEVIEAVDVLRKGTSDKNITLLHANSAYPTPVEDVNLKAMLSLKKTSGLSVGFSDHTTEVHVPVSAVALGAEVIEKHFTLNNYMIGPDHKSSLEPLVFLKMVENIRDIEKALGKEEKFPTKSELQNIVAARKSIVASKRIKKGEVFTEKNITVKRPGNGISPMKWYEVLGSKAVKDYEKDNLI